YLTDVNLHFITGICKYLEIKTEIRFSSEFVLAEEKTQRLVDICRDLNVSDYYSGPAAKAYMETEKFNNHNIDVHYWDYSNYPKYNQLHGEFEHAVSIIDLIMNEGPKSLEYLKF
ncbi:MAG: WbqC family protein, partial [Bacteroidia bacterium]|nr:WbqC family protein [Bacteroidia bacterium]